MFLRQRSMYGNRGVFQSTRGMTSMEYDVPLPWKDGTPETALR